MKPISICLMFALTTPLLASEGVRCQLQEVVYQIMPDGSTRPIDHQVVDVFPLDFENQYGSIEKESANGAYGATYFEVPASSGRELNHNIYIHIKDGPIGMVTDGYHNGRVPGSLFKMTALTMRRVDDKVRCRVMHVIDPPPGDGAREMLEGAALRDLQQKVDLFLR